MTMITPSYLGETIEYSSLHACRSTLEDPTSFYAQHDDWQFPPRWRGTRDFGPSKFGRYPGDPARYSGRRVDLLGRSLSAAPGTDPADAICRYLTTARTRSARELAAKAVVLIHPRDRVGEVVWPSGIHQAWRA